MSFGDVSKNSYLEQENIPKLTIFLQLSEIKINGTERENKHAGTRIRTWVTAATTQCPNH